ncbi:MAG: hypothetical protein QM526_00185 [Alphaproteobacteria bacterium]|nr:hypothetical protein [Alphaproteobacteria bacterium]
MIVTNTRKIIILVTVATLFFFIGIHKSFAQLSNSSAGVFVGGTIAASVFLRSFGGRILSITPCNLGIVFTVQNKFSPFPIFVPFAVMAEKGSIVEPSFAAFGRFVWIPSGAACPIGTAAIPYWGYVYRLGTSKIPTK